MEYNERRIKFGLSMQMATWIMFNIENFHPILFLSFNTLGLHTVFSWDGNHPSVSLIFISFLLHKHICRKQLTLSKLSMSKIIIAWFVLVVICSWEESNISIMHAIYESTSDMIFNDHHIMILHLSQGSLKMKRLLATNGTTNKQ